MTTTVHPERSAAGTESRGLHARLLPLVILIVIACGPAPKGPQPNITYFWNVTDSTLEWGSMCSDDPDFRGLTKPIDFGANSYLIYKTSSDGKSAVMQECTQVDPSTCTPSTDGMTLSVAGTELSFSGEQNTVITNSTCTEQDTQQWLMDDNGPTMTLEIDDTLSLVDSPTNPGDCDNVDNDAKAHSTNGMGYQGCVIAFHLSGELKLPVR